MSLKKEFDSNKIILITLEDINYTKGVIELLKEFSGKKILYVLLNKSYLPLDEEFKKNNIDTSEFYYINMSRDESKKADTSNVYRLDSTSALTELSIIIDRSLKQGYDYLFLDSVTNFLIYNSAEKTKKFMIDLTNKIRNSQTKAAYYSLDSKITQDLIKNLGAFVDKTIKIEIEY